MSAIDSLSMMPWTVFMVLASLFLGFFMALVLDRNRSLVHSIYTSIIKLRSFTVNPTVPSSEVNVVEEFSLIKGEYESLRAAPISREAREEFTDTGFLVEVIKSENPDSKFILLYSGKQDFFDEFDNMTGIGKFEEDHLSGSLSDVVECWRCYEENMAYISQSGDEIKFITGWLGTCTTPVSSREGVYLCQSCCEDVYKKVLSSDEGVVENSDAVLREL